MAEVPMKLGIIGPREGPLLSSSERNRERLPDCPREGRLNPGGSQRSAKRPSDFRKPANCNGRYTERQSNNLKGGSHFSTIRFVGRTSCEAWQRVSDSGAHHVAAGGWEPHALCRGASPRELLTGVADGLAAAHEAARVSSGWSGAVRRRATRRRWRPRARCCASASSIALL